MSRLSQFDRTFADCRQIRTEYTSEAEHLSQRLRLAERYVPADRLPEYHAAVARIFGAS